MMHGAMGSQRQDVFFEPSIFLKSKHPLELHHCSVEVSLQNGVWRCMFLMHNCCLLQPLDPPNKTTCFERFQGPLGRLGVYDAWGSEASLLLRLILDRLKIQFPPLQGKKHIFCGFARNITQHHATISKQYQAIVRNLSLWRFSICIQVWMSLKHRKMASTFQQKDTASGPETAGTWLLKPLLKEYLPMQHLVARRLLQRMLRRHKGQQIPRRISGS